ncbi:hypothetical protein Anapl_16480 [Anas platyrhynchos]|uniref:Uncharacterized protein n=1 Tax=Anas platyrhynchos TaxID=8839 RepID=R0LKZ0_ANAPL|nr:hypothetical protein Anapl_16480 [Anas platyrhynchos]
MISGFKLRTYVSGGYSGSESRLVYLICLGVVAVQLSHLPRKISDNSKRVMENTKISVEQCVEAKCSALLLGHTLSLAKYARAQYNTHTANTSSMFKVESKLKEAYGNQDSFSENENSQTKIEVLPLKSKYFRSNTKDFLSEPSFIPYCNQKTDPLVRCLDHVKILINKPP